MLGYMASAALLISLSAAFSSLGKLCCCRAAALTAPSLTHEVGAWQCCTCLTNAPIDKSVQHCGLLG